MAAIDPNLDDALCEKRYQEAPKVLKEYWRQDGWTPFSPEEFYVTWGGLFRYARALLICEIRGHKWCDCRYDLTGEAGDSRNCERCWRNEVLRE